MGTPGNGHKWKVCPFFFYFFFTLSLFPAEWKANMMVGSVGATVAHKKKEICDAGGAAIQLWATYPQISLTQENN